MMTFKPVRPWRGDPQLIDHSRLSLALLTIGDALDVCQRLKGRHRGRSLAALAMRIAKASCAAGRGHDAEALRLLTKPEDR